MRLLIVGTLEGHITAAGKIAMQRGAKVAHIETVDRAITALRNGQGGDLVMIDVKLDIARFVEGLKAERIHVPVVACGVGTDAQAAVRAIRAGAKEYIPLPPDARLIAAVLEAVAEEANQFISADPSMQAILRMTDQIAPSDATVLITGESGTGKEVMARYIHKKSRRANEKFVSVNCAAIPEHLLESELFGHEKGAFTGAVARRIGKFEEANGGTLLLDEISEMDIRLQAKLLRAIQEREIDRVGGTDPVKVNIRLIATSNRNLEQAVQDGTFREDLYFRLNVVNLQLPPLRARPADISLLADHFVAKYAESNGVDARTLSPAARAKILAHHWRGNVRELENTMHRAVLLTRGEVIESDAIILAGQSLAPDPAQALVAATTILAAPGHVPASPAGHNTAHSMAHANAHAAYTQGNPPAPGSQAVPARPTAALVGRTVADVERDLILETLHHTLGNRTHAANILGISIRTLRNKLKQYNEEGVPIPPPGQGELDGTTP